MNYFNFENSNGYSPVKFQDFAWMGEYINNSCICEFDPKTGEKQDFYKINKSNLKKFGLIGMGMKLFFNTADGVFNLNGREIDIFYKDNGVEYSLTKGIANYNDIITYKDAHTDADIKNPNQRYVNRINAFNFGYKTKLSSKGASFMFQCIVSIPYNSPAYMEIKLVSDKDLDGDLVIRNNGRESSIKAPLKKGKAGQLNWIIR